MWQDLREPYYDRWNTKYAEELDGLEDDEEAHKYYRYERQLEI